MTYMEFLEKLVNTQSEDERMELVKEQGKSFEKVDNSEEIEELKNQVVKLKQEIKDRFFGKHEDIKENEIKEDEDENVEKNVEENEVTIKDLGFGQKTY